MYIMKQTSMYDDLYVPSIYMVLRSTTYINNHFLIVNLPNSKHPLKYGKLHHISCLLFRYRGLCSSGTNHPGNFYQRF